MINIAANKHTEATTVDTLNRMFPDYNFLKPLTSGIQSIESFWCFHRKEIKHYNLLLLHAEEILPQCIENQLEIFNTVSGIKHPNLISIFEAWILQNKLYIVTDYEDSMTLESTLNEGRLSLHSVLNLSIQLLDCVSTIHKHKIAHGRITPDNIQIKNNFLRVAPPTLDHFFQAALYQTSTKQQQFLVDDPETNGVIADLYSIGSVIFFMSTGYSPKTLDPNLWEEYGLAPELKSIVLELIEPDKISKKTADNVRKKIIALKDELFPDKAVKPNLLTKLLRLRATRPIQEHQVIHPIEYNTLPGEHYIPKKNKHYNRGDVIGERFVIQEMIERENFDIVYRATDNTLNNRNVWLHFFSFAQGLNWKSRFEVITNQLAKVNHPHISHVIDAQILDDGAYLVTQKEDGERLSFFTRRHAFNYEEILEFSKQVVDALMAAEEYGFNVHTLNLDTIAVYRHAKSGYYYRLTSVGHSHFLALVHGDENGLKLMMKPETLAPELHDKNPQGHLTTQFMLGNVIFELLTEGHPCKGQSALQAYNHHISAAFPKIADHRDDIPAYFQRWVAQLMKVNPQERFKSLREAYDMILRAPETNAATANIDSESA